MATLNPQILLAQQHYKLPDVNIGETFTNIARIKAYQQAQKLEELKYGQAERAMARDDEFQRLASQLYTQDAQATQPPPRGLAGGPSAPIPGGPPPPAAAPPAPGGLSMAGSVPAPPPGQNYAQAPPAINQMPDAAQAGYQRAPSDMQSLATATAPMAGAQMPGMPPGIPAPTSMEPGTFTMAQGGPQPPGGLASGVPAGGYLGPQDLGGGQTATALMQTVTDPRLNGGKPTNIPLIVPGIPPDEIKAIAAGQRPSQAAHERSIAHALRRQQAGETLPAYGSIPEAEQAARGESDERGTRLHSPAGAPPPAPPAPPGGLGGAQPGEPKPLLPQMNERVMAQLFAANPEKAGKLIESQLSVQSKKLEQTEKTNELVYQGLTALQASPNPAAMYPVMLQGLREKGVQIPASFPKEYDPALMAFKLKEHETLKHQIDLAKVDVEKNTALLRQQQAQTEQAQAGLYKAQTGKATAEAGAVPTEIALKEAQARKALADTAETQQKTANLINDRKKEAGQVFEYTKDSDWNVYLSQAMKEAGLPPGTSPNDHPDVIAKARQYQTEDKQKVVRDTGLSAAQKAQGPAATKRLEASNAKGSSAEQVMNVLDEIDRLIDEGVYENVPTDQTKMLAFWGGFRPDDAKAARTKRLYELGNQLTVGMAPNGSLGTGMSEGDRQTFERAGGDLQSNQAALSRKETIKSMRALGKINMQDANKVWETHEKTGEFPRFGSAREERLKILTPRILKEAYEARKKDGWTEAQIREGFLAQGWREE